MMSRRFPFLLIVLLGLVAIVAARVLATDVQITACQAAPTDEGVPVVWVGYTTPAAYDAVMFTATLRRNGPVGVFPGSLAPGAHPFVFFIEFHYPDEPVTVEIYDALDLYIRREVTPDAPPCPPRSGTGQPDGGLIQIVKLVESEGDYLWEIYGAEHWHQVTTTQAEWKGEAWQVVLVLGPDNPNHDPDNYRVARIE